MVSVSLPTAPVLFAPEKEATIVPSLLLSRNQPIFLLPFLSPACVVLFSCHIDFSLPILCSAPRRAYRLVAAWCVELKLARGILVSRRVYIRCKDDEARIGRKKKKRLSRNSSTTIRIMRTMMGAVLRTALPPQRQMRRQSGGGSVRL